jgi:hypothetical protein
MIFTQCGDFPGNLNASRSFGSVPRGVAASETVGYLDTVKNASFFTG